MLTLQEKKYFDKIVNSILCHIDVCVPIIPCNHETLEKKHKEALGCAWSYNKKDIYQITIDEYFIKECYLDYLWNKGYRDNGIFPKIENSSLEEIICHEIAHIEYWRHGKKHTELSQYLYDNYNKATNLIENKSI